MAKSKEYWSERLRYAIKLASEYHYAQIRANGDPFILHPLRVMMKMTTLLEMTVAVLHDVLEDTECSSSRLFDVGYDMDVIGPVQILTHAKDVAYSDYIAQVAKDEVACVVKMADLEDNMNLNELPRVEDAHLARLKKYWTAYNFLTTSNQGSHS